MSKAHFETRYTQSHVGDQQDSVLAEHPGEWPFLFSLIMLIAIYASNAQLSKSLWSKARSMANWRKESQGISNKI